MWVLQQIRLGNGEEAIMMVSSWSPQLIFMDVRMPIKDGYEATREIKKTIRGEQIPIIEYRLVFCLKTRKSLEEWYGEVYPQTLSGRGNIFCYCRMLRH